MIDLTGITQIADVVIKFYSTNSSINVRLISDLPDIEDSLFALRAKGISVFNNFGEFQIFPNGYDLAQLAERIAMYVESKGYRVQRLVTDPGAIDKTPKMEIQSFILA